MKFYTKLLNVKSSNIKAVGYGLFQNKENKTYKPILEILFANKRGYRYYDVPSGLAKGLMNSSSKGKYLNEFIKYIYKFRELSK